MKPTAHKGCLARLNRIEGQVRGIVRMIEDDRYCIDIVQQLQAVRAALKRVEGEVLKDHVEHCVDHAIRSGDKREQREKVAELLAVFGKSLGR
jgi:DNA-binding FrmR family transcriptional regulator